MFLTYIKQENRVYSVKFRHGIQNFIESGWNKNNLSWQRVEKQIYLVMDRERNNYIGRRQQQHERNNF